MPTTQTAKRPGALQTILIVTLVVGTLDAIAAIVLTYINHDLGPLPVFRYIASGVFGPDAFNGGLPMALWGLLFHYIIAAGWVTFLYVVYPFAMKVLKNKFIVGLIFGIEVWIGMNLIVVPLSQVPPGKDFDIFQATINAIILIIAVGIPSSLMIHARLEGYQD